MASLPDRWEDVNKQLFAKSLLVTAATILGVGILALPVKVSRGGVEPFAATFSVAFVCQALVICFLTELLQRTEAMMLAEDQAGEDPEESAGFLTEGGGEASPATPGRGTGSFASLAPRRRGRAAAPNLHTMAQYFVPHPWLRGFFDFCVYVHFIVIMVAYAIAAANAVSKLTPFTYDAIAVLFVCGFAVAIAKLDEALTSAVAWFTLFKGSLLLLMILIVAYVASDVQRSYTNDWGRAGDAFLIGTISLGGSVNTVPVIYSSFKRTRENIVSFRAGCLAATALCFALNLVWCYAVLSVVPQQSEGGGPSLERALEQHDISTIPLLQFLQDAYPQYAFLGVVVNVFIILSVSVSFMAYGLGMKHYLDGAAAGFAERQLSVSAPYDVPQVALAFYIGSFAMIFTCTYAFSQSLYIILDVFNSAVLNIETGCFIAYMAWYTRLSSAAPATRAAVELPRAVLPTGIALTSLYFGGAVAFDLYETLHHLATTGTLR
eukprot:TRINITY_DN18235_c0_g1_i1.p1 TRINITY_DN18235_c0_g1~~TRINITY_DN18235_c0_g1_i1.p1  ORF type:complete len:492 (+),score=181.28 TRINITY_DN18235_c0_g1_i1:62-1537(+)